MFYLLIFHVYHWLCFLFRDGVSESQFNQVLNIELDQIIKVLLPTHFVQLSELKWQTLLLNRLNFQTLWSFFFIFYFIFAGIPSPRQRRGASQVHLSGCTEKPSYKAFPGWFHRKRPPWFASFLNLWCPKPHESVPLASSHGRWVFPFFFCESDLNIFFFVIFLQELWLTLRLFILETMISTCVPMLESLWVLHLWLEFPASHSFRNNLGRTLK